VRASDRGRGEYAAMQFDRKPAGGLAANQAPHLAGIAPAPGLGAYV
jgi:hypothetical protein